MKTPIAILLSALSFPLVAAQRPAAHFSAPQMMTIARRDKLHFFAPQPKVDSRTASLAVVPFYSHVAEFFLPEPVNVIGVEETLDFKSWRVVYIEDPKLWIGLGFKRCPFQTPNGNAYYRAFVRNQNSP